MEREGERERERKRSREKLIIPSVVLWDTHWAE